MKKELIAKERRCKEYMEFCSGNIVYQSKAEGVKLIEGRQVVNS